MDAFLSTLIDEDMSFGQMAPLQLMPLLHVDLCQKTINSRIEDAMPKPRGRDATRGRGGHGGRGGRGGRVGRVGTSKKVQGDPLVATYQTCIAMHNALNSVLDKGMLTFAPFVRPLPLSAKRPGKYVKRPDSYAMQVLTKDGTQQPVLAGIPPLAVCSMHASNCLLYTSPSPRD